MLSDLADFNQNSFNLMAGISWAVVIGSMVDGPLRAMLPDSTIAIVCYK